MHRTEGTPFLDFFPHLLCKPQIDSFSSSLTIDFPAGKARLSTVVMNGLLFPTEATASPRIQVRKAVRKAIRCEESKAGEHLGPNTITGMENILHCFWPGPGLVTQASAPASSKHSSNMGFANQSQGHPLFLSLPLSPHIPLAVHHPSHGGPTAAPLPQFFLHFPSPLYSPLSFSP